MLSINSLFYYYDVSVRSAHRQVLPYLIVLDLRHTSWPLRKGCLLSFYPAFPLADKLRSSCRKVWPSQTLCLLLMTDMTALSSPTRLNTSSLQTLSDQEMLETFSKATSHISAASTSPRFDSIQKSTPDDSLYNSLLQAKAEGSCQQFFPLNKCVLCSGYSRR